MSLGGCVTLGAGGSEPEFWQQEGYLALTAWPLLQEFITGEHQWDISETKKGADDQLLAEKLRNAWAQTMNINQESHATLSLKGAIPEIPQLDLMSGSTFTTGLMIVGLMSVVGLVGIGLTYAFRKKKIIEMSSYSLSSLSALGFIITNIALLLYGLGPDQICTAPPDDVEKVIWYNRFESQVCASLNGKSFRKCRESYSRQVCNRQRGSSQNTLCEWQQGTQPCITAMSTLCHLQKILLYTGLCAIFMPLFFKVYKVAKIFSLTIPGELLRKKPKKDYKAIKKRKKQENLTEEEARRQLRNLTDEDHEWMEKNPSWWKSYRNSDKPPPFKRSEIIQMHLDRKHGVARQAAEKDEAKGLVLRAVKVETLTKAMRLELKTVVITATTLLVTMFSFWMHPLKYNLVPLDVPAARRFWGSCSLCVSRFNWDPNVGDLVDSEQATANSTNIYLFQHLIPILFMVPFFFSYGLYQVLYVMARIRNKQVGDTASLLWSLYTSPIMLFGILCAERGHRGDVSGATDFGANLVGGLGYNGSYTELTWLFMLLAFSLWGVIFYWNLFYSKLWSIWRGTDAQISYIQFHRKTQSWGDWLLCKKFTFIAEEDCVGINMRDFKSMSMKYAKDADFGTIDHAQMEDLDMKEYELDGKNMLMDMRAGQTTS